VIRFRKYNTLLVTGSTAIRIPIVKRGVVDHAVGADWTPASGDVKISIDGAAPANVTNLPVATASGNSALWEFILTAAELTCKQAVITISDSATKAIEDDGFVVETFGHASAMYAADLSAANLPTNVIQIGGQSAGAAGGVTFPTDPADQSLIIAATDALLATIAALNNLSAAQVRTELNTELGRIDATVSSRAAPGAAMTLEAGERTSVATAVWSSATRTLSSFGSLIADIWAYATRTLTSGAAPSAAENAAAVWDKPLSEHVTAGSAGAGLSAAQAAGDPWSTAVPGAYASGTAGHKFGNLPTSAGIASGLTGVSSVEFMGSPMQGPRVILVRGSAYLKSQEMAPYQRIAKAAYPDMGLDTVVGFRMKVFRSDDTFEVIVDGVIESFDATYWNLYADLSSADTALLIVGEGVAQFWVELDGIDEEITVSEYKLTVKHGVGVA
jgi:hypothetical protein